MSIPQAVLDVLEKLDASDKDVVLSYLNELQAQATGSAKAGGDAEPESEILDEEMEDNNEEEDNREPPAPPLYSSGEDFEKASSLKQEAADLMASGDWEGALNKYTEAILAAPPSALLYANRAIVLLKLDRPRTAERDCNEALKENPDSAKALRVRGKARKALGKYEEALKDLSASQQIDFDEETVEDLKFLTDKRIELEKAEAAERIEKEERLRKKAEEIKKANEEAKKGAKKAKSSMPRAGMPGMGGGMPGMPGGAGMEGLMASLMSDPELVEAMQKPNVQAAFQELMGEGGMPNPAKVQELMSDPDVGPVLKKMMGKFGAGAMGGGGFPGGGGFSGAAAGGDDDNIPNIDDDLDDIPDPN